MTRLRAYAFKSDKDIVAIRDRLNEIGPWKWIDRDSDRWGEYISATVPGLDTGMAKLFVEDSRYVINLLLKSERADAQRLFDGVFDVVFTYLLPAIDASDVAEVEADD
jgi:hypothetical protein